MKSVVTFFAIIGSLGAFAQTQRILNLRTDWKFTIGDREEYASPSYDDSNWEVIRVPSAWEDEGFLSYNGFAWYRYSFDGERLDGMENLLLNLGYIDDANETYFNGELIGFNGSFPPNFYTAYDALTEYKIPEELINRIGKNTIAIKVYDVHLAGGIVQGEIGIYYQSKLPKEYFSLEGVWKFTTRDRTNWETLYHNDESWENIIVPSYWRSKHIKWYQGWLRTTRHGWYRKEFNLPEKLRNEDLYLMLGLIDDFDRTYLNGHLIGETNDDRPFGDSQSYKEYRIYKIPRGLINQHGSNVVAVEVEDIGIDAGIYEGPIGIVTEEDLAKVYRLRR